jgi:ATP-dependent DNA helicase RecQ
MGFADLMRNILLLDLETTRSGRINHIGAVLNETVFEKKEKAGSTAILKQLDDLGQKASFVLGHNLLGHDFPILKAVSPWLKILNKPVIDTLYLSPIAFPQNPYHRLVKNYKLVKSSINRPVEDAKLAASIYQDQWENFVDLGRQKPFLIDFYRFCFEDSLFNGFSGMGLSWVFSQISSKEIKNPDAAFEGFLEHTLGKVCINAAKETIPPILAKAENRPIVAYCMAWLQVAGGNSVLPPWVRHRFPEIPTIIKKLRFGTCCESSCKYCAETNNPERHLINYFEYPYFREKPKTDQNESLQRTIVVNCMKDIPLMGILPTGGGKSLCYQLPALVRYQRNGALTVVISPLQALMKDQVDNLVKKTGTLFAEAIYGLQTPPERGAVFDRIRLGDTAILYISPEQLRSTSVRNILRQREIGCWVFDEAHCLSKWGHDFRPDYLYAARFIREFSKEQDLPIPPVCCFTATAKQSVIEEIVSHFREELEMDLHLYSGGVERDNLNFEVIPVSAAEKLSKAFEIVTEHLNALNESSVVIIYAATRKSTEEVRDFMQHQGLEVEAFHAGLNAKEKREIIETFVAEKVPVICATNAFGMGIDKENIRLVLHYEIPGSLENYIQEAGRAGRDLKPAYCILLYDPLDVNKQFGITEISKVNRKEISRILRVLRRKKKNQYGEIVVTTDDLLRDDDLAGIKDLKPEFRESKIKTAIAWLEKAGYLERNQNLTDVFQGKPLVKSLEEAKEVIDRLNIDPYSKNLWLNILRFIFNSPEDKGIRADALAEAMFPDMEKLLILEEKTGLAPGQLIIKALHEMADAKLIDKGIMLTAIFRPKGLNNSSTVLQSICDLEKKIVFLLQEEDPDADDGTWVELNLRRLNQKLSNEGFNTNPDVIRQLIKGISYDGKGMAASKGSFELSQINRNRYQVRLQRSWKNIKETIFIRQNVAAVILHALTEIAKKHATEKNIQIKGDVEISFASDDLSKAIKSDIILSAKIKNSLAAIDRALMFLHEQKVITLQSGLAILRQAMTIRLNPEAKRRYYNKGDFEPLSIHYMEKRFQVHVMMRYAMLATEKIAQATSLVLDYFTLGRIKFLNKYFKNDKDLITTATTAETFRNIVENLRNPVQISAVGSPVEDNMLILAGPGSGKTTVIIHRCAYLLEVERIPANQILVLCFNHSSSILLRKRLKNLVGKSANGVTIATYHGAAMRLTGISIRDMTESKNKEDINFNQIIDNAIQLLKGEKDIPGIEPDEMRDRLIAGYSHILVDEYQDIDEAQYNFVSAIAGRTLEEEDGRLTIMAVGDDDQNIYTFRGANVRFIQKFQEDYGKKVIYLVENYRSSKHIIAASNALIKANQDRMKHASPISINKDRAGNLSGGRWEYIDPVGKGFVQIVTVSDLVHQATYVRSEIDRIMNLDPNTDWKDFAILSRTKAPLTAVRSVLESAGYPLKTNLDEGFPLHRVREIRMTIKWLKSKEKENIRTSKLKADLNGFGEKKDNMWWQLINSFFDSYQDETMDSIVPIGWIIDRFYEYIAEQRREKVIGQGIYLGTIHSAKGMEFPHVFILDGDWNRPMSSGQREEERRIMYVGMTRAEETLRLLKIPKTANPFLNEIKGNFSIPLIYKGASDEGHHVNKKYEVMGLDQIYLDYAGAFQESHPIHNHLAKIETGQSVFIQKSNSKIEIRCCHGNCLARLSNHGFAKWVSMLDSILDVKVIAMLQRNQDDPDDSFQKMIKAEEWELPMLEVIYSDGL